MNEATKVCYWLQGFIEITENKVPTIEQWNKIQETIQHADVNTISDGLMKPEAFIVWMQGFIDLDESRGVTEKQWNIIKEHLQLVFIKVTSSEGETKEDTNKKLEKALKELSEIHNKDKDIWRIDPTRNPLDVTFGPNKQPDVYC